MAGAAVRCGMDSSRWQGDDDFVLRVRRRPCGERRSQTRMEHRQPCEGAPPDGHLLTRSAKVYTQARNSLKTWSGRRDSNPRRPAWECARRLKTKDNCV